jgi:hypothetical protein
VRNERVILCGGLHASGNAKGKATVPLSLWGKDSNVTLKVGDISQKMVANIAPVLIDLLEIATYVYCADQATARGGRTSRDYGAQWRRQFQFHIPVREPDLWSAKPVRSALCDTLGFLSDDEYAFTFKKLAKPPPVDQYLDFGAVNAPGFQAEEVVLFSGGLDSLGGAIQEVIADKRSIALVSHRSNPKIDSRQRALLLDLKQKSLPQQPFHVPVWINKEKALGREYTQRTRSFLYASLGAIVARIFDLWRIRFYENGVVSINLPISPQVVGGRATRTTHPQVLNGFSEIFSAIFQKPFAVENPFCWMTKAEVVKSIRDRGCGDLVKHTVSCTHVWEMTTMKTHCGTCSQCIDRRFGTLAAGCPDAEDPEEMYGVDLLRGERPPGDSRTMLESYVGMAKRVRSMSDTAFFTEFGEVHRVTRQIHGMSVHDAATRILALYKRHATEVGDVIARGIRDHAQDISDGTLPSSSLLILALPDEYKRPATVAEAPTIPALILDAIKHADVRRMLLVQKATTEGLFALLAYAALLGDKERCSTDPGERMAVTDVLDVLTPVCKAYGSEAAYDSIVLAIQCLGGYGFSEEFPLAQMLRDCKVFPIYEGTNGIQAMDLLGRKVVMKGGDAFRAVLAEISKTLDEAARLDALQDMVNKTRTALSAVTETTTHLGGIAMGGDIEAYMSAATPYLRMFSGLVISWLFVWQSVVAQPALAAAPNDADRRYYTGKLATARFYLNNELPHLHATAQILTSGERTALDFDEAWF